MLSSIMWSQLLVCYLFYPMAIALITCRNCQHSPDNETEWCDGDCLGDYCYLSQYYYEDGDPEHTFTNKGCVIGAIPSEGCRVNQDGQAMCFCRTNACNGNSSQFRDQLMNSTRRLTVRSCDRKEQNEISTNNRWIRPCASNYCTYKEMQYRTSSGSGTAIQAGCSLENDFDAFTSQSVFFFYPESCGLLEYGGQPKELSCYYSLPLMPSTSVFSALTVECHVDFYSPSLPHIWTGGFCRGQWCVIAANPQGDVHRGCLSLDQTRSTRQMKDGFYTSISGVEQWLCSQNRCNWDVATAEASWNESLAVYRNISRLHESPIFELINAADSNNSFRGLCIAIILSKLLVYIVA